jgi:hypothetical protein
MIYKNVKEGEFSKYDMIQAETTIDSFEKHLDEAQEAMESRNLSDSCQHLYQAMQMLGKLSDMQSYKQQLDLAHHLLEQKSATNILTHIKWSAGNE